MLALLLKKRRKTPLLQMSHGKLKKPLVQSYLRGADPQMQHPTRLNQPKARLSWSFLETFLHLYERVRKYEKSVESGVTPAEGVICLPLYQRISKMKAS